MGTLWAGDGVCGWSRALTSLLLLLCRPFSFWLTMLVIFTDRESVIVGYSDMSEEEVEDLFEEMKGEFVGASYNVLARSPSPQATLRGRGELRCWDST